MAAWSTASDEKIIDTITAIFRLVLERDDIVLTMNTFAEDVPEWDSMTSVTLAVEIEHVFEVKVRAAEMESLQSISDLVGLIRQHSAVASG